MSIRARTYFLLILPLAGIVLLVAWGWAERDRTLDEVVALGDRVDLMARGGELLHVAQLERGETAGWLGLLEAEGSEAEVPAGLATVRAEVDERAWRFGAELDGLAPEGTRRVWEETHDLAAAVDSLPRVRDAVGRRELGADEATRFYARLNEALLEVVSRAAHGATHPELASFQEAYTSMLRLKEAAGVERGLVYAALARGYFLPGERDTLVVLTERQSLEADRFSAAWEALPAEVVGGEWEDPTAAWSREFRERVLEEGVGGADLDPESWFEAQSTWIDRLHEVERGVLAALEERTVALEQRARWERSAYGWAGLGLVVLTLTGAGFMVRSISGPLDRLRDELERLGEDEGVREASLDEEGPPELASIARAFNAHAGRLRELLERSEESEAKFAGILETSGDAIISVDEEQRIQLFNRGAEEIFGYASDEILGEPLDVLIPERQREAHRRHVQAFAETVPIRARRMGERDEVAGLRKDGEEFPAEAAIWKLKLGESWMLNVVLRDVTEQRRAEEELARRARELERSNADLEQFAYVASHDLQEPLRMVGSYTQLLQRRYQGRLGDDADEFIGYAVDGVSRMQELINDLLTYSRVGRRGGPLEPTALDGPLDRALGNLKVSLEETGASISRDELPTVHGDRVQLTQLFQNLVGNAIRFRGEEAPRIHVGAERRESAPHGPEWVISVRDNGIGMDPEHLERVFLIFQRLHGRGRYPGTGIGLAIAKKIVEYHGGRIWAESEPERGSTFHFTLPDGPS